MLEKYRSRVECLPLEAVSLLASLLPRSCATALTGQELYTAAQASGLCHADLCAPLLPRTDPISETTLETLIGKPLRRIPAGQQALLHEEARRQVQRIVRVDNRTIHNIVPNPKQVNSKSWQRFKLYREGMTVSEYTAAGGLMTDIRWDAKKGFIELRGRM